MPLTRRQFLKGAGLVAAAAALPVGSGLWASPPAPPADYTTLARTVVKGSLLRRGTAGAYYRLAEGPGEPHMRREELGRRSNPDLGTTMLSFVHITDVHILDAESPARVEFLDRYNDLEGCEGLLFRSAFCPQETLMLQVAEAMIRQLRAVASGPVTGRQFEFCICTGDFTDNAQMNEIRGFIDVMDGGKEVTIRSGSPAYEGVQLAAWGDDEYWHPDAGVQDKYKQQWGFPEYPGLLEDAMLPFTATGIGMPWLQTYGNHDGLVQGNFPRFFEFERLAVSGLKPTGLPPGMNPCDAFTTFMTDPTAIAAAPARPVTADPSRRIATRRQYVEEMFKTTGTPPGHGLTQENLRTGVAYWVDDSRPGFRLIGLDTVNPGGHDRGSIGQAQLRWIEDRLKEVSSVYFDAGGAEVRTSSPDRLVILFSHHGLRSMDPIFNNPDPAQNEANDQPRFRERDVEPLIHRFPNVIAWLSGHTHDNIVVPRTAPGRRGFWDIGTAAHLDWGCQSRLLEVVDNLDGTLSIFCTMVDLAAPAEPPPREGSDVVLRLASISRELAANDYQKGFGGTPDSLFGEGHIGTGELKDRNVELVMGAPFDLSTLRKAPALADTL